MKILEQDYCHGFTNFDGYGYGYGNGYGYSYGNGNGKGW
jgi:hypothetical protein